MTAMPRAGLHGFTDRMVGPGAGAGEQALTYGTAGIGALTAVALPVWHGAGWHPLHLAVVALVAFDFFGGVVANATDAGRRWWHRPGRGARHQLAFVALHVQPFVLAWLVPGFGWTDAGAVYGTLLVAAAAVLALPDHLRRPGAFAATAMAVTVFTTLLPVPAELGWVAPVLTIKLLLAHLLPDRLRSVTER